MTEVIRTFCLRKAPFFSTQYGTDSTLCTIYHITGICEVFYGLKLKQNSTGYWYADRDWPHYWRLVEISREAYCGRDV